jgi:di/tricarboxylate transporter/CRP-like cAMP-binding protein
MAIRDISLGQDHAEFLRDTPLLSALDPITLARLAARLQVVRLDDGDDIVRHGEPGDALYVVSRGHFGVFAPSDGDAGDKRLRTCRRGEVIGEIALLTGGVRTATVRAEGEAEALRLDRHDFDQLMATEPSFSRALAATLSRRLGAAVGSPGSSVEMVAAPPMSDPGDVAPHTSTQLVSSRQAIGLVLAALTLCAGWLVPQPAGFSVEAWHAAATFCAIVPLMMFEALPDAAIALGLVATWVLGGVTTPEVALSGFASGSWVLTIAIFIVGAVVASSGVLFRIALWSVEHSRGGFKTQAMALCVSGWISSAAIPNPTGRMLLVAPAITEMAEAFGYAAGSRGAAGLAMAALMGFGQTFAPFLTSSTTAVLTFTLLPAASRAGLDWSSWALRAAPTYAVLLIGMLAYIVWRYSPHTRETPSPRGQAVPVQRALLGRASRQEWIAGAVIVGLLAGFATQPLHHIDAAWIAVAALAALAALGLVTSETLRMVNWNYALWFGTLASMVGVFSTTSLDRSLAGVVVGAFDGVVGNPVVCVGVLTLVCFGVSFVLRFAAAAPMLTVALAPIATTLGIDPWIVGFVALIGTSGFFLPFQSSTYQAIHQELNGRLFSHRQVRSVGLVYALLSLVALVASLPMWHLMGLV